jgi:tetratricopeptide (TPR) repeat protein
VALAMALDQLGRLEEAEAALRRALELEPDNLRIHGLLAQNLQKRGLHGSEIEVYRGVLKENPHHQRTLQSLADAQLSQNDLEGAIATLEEIERRYPDDLRSVVRLGFLEYEAREWAEAALRFERFLAEYPEEYEVVFFLGSARRRAGDEEGALEALASIPPEHKNYADARTEIAALLERRGDYAGALAEVERANAASPSQSLELYAATLRAKSGDFDGAVAHLEQLLSERPSDDELLYNLGVIYGEAKRHDDAIRYMRLALEQNPDNASALNYVGYSFAEKGIRLDEAEGMIRRALELRPDDGYITDSLGWVYYMRARPLVESGRGAEAEALLERALREVERADELTGGDPVVSEHLGDIHLLRGDKQRALENFEEAVELEPRSSEQPELFEKLERLRQELLREP